MVSQTIYFALLKVGPAEHCFGNLDIVQHTAPIGIAALRVVVDASDPSAIAIGHAIPRHKFFRGFMIAESPI